MATTASAAAPATTSTGSGPETTTNGSAEYVAASNDLYTRRIAPFLATDHPNTCNTCHLSGVDMELFVQDDLTDPASSGHDKFADRNDPADIDFLSSIEREAACTP